MDSVSVRVHVAGNEVDRLALLAFKAQITGDPFGALNLWNEFVHFCQWAGVTCGRRHKRVTVNIDRLHFASRWKSELP